MGGEVLGIQMLEKFRDPGGSGTLPASGLATRPPRSFCTVSSSRGRE